MAKAQFHKNQKVWVESVGAWATVERINPIWAKGFDEPVKITYEVGFGREFQASELRAEDEVDEVLFDEDGAPWRVLRVRNKWQAPEDCSHHPFPGSFPVVVTDRRDWGGWRVPGAEYDRDPGKFERQARLLVVAPKLLKLAAELEEFVGDQTDDAPGELIDLARRARALVRHVADEHVAPSGKVIENEAMAAE